MIEQMRAEKLANQSHNNDWDENVDMGQTSIELEGSVTPMAIEDGPTQTGTIQHTAHSTRGRDVAIYDSKAMG